MSSTAEQTRHPAPVLGGRTGARQTLLLSNPVANSHTGVLHRYRRTLLTLTHRDGSWLGRPGCAGHVLLEHPHCHAPGSHRCPEGPQIPSSHGAVLPHHPHSSWGIFLVSNWLTVSLCHLFAFQEGFPFIPPRPKLQLGFSRPRVRVVQVSSLSQLCYLGKDLKARQQGPVFLVPVVVKQWWFSTPMGFRHAFWSPPVLQKTMKWSLGRGARAGPGASPEMIICGYSFQGHPQIETELVLLLLSGVSKITKLCLLPLFFFH